MAERQTHRLLMKRLAAEDRKRRPAVAWRSSGGSELLEGNAVATQHSWELLRTKVAMMVVTFLSPLLLLLLLSK